MLVTSRCRRGGRWFLIAALTMALSIAPAAADETKAPANTGAEEGASQNWFTNMFNIETEDSKTESAPVPVESAAPVSGADKKVSAAPGDGEEADKDPLEGYNRFMFKFNQALHGAIIDPLVDGYQAITPDPLEKAISNAAKNLNEPITAGSSLLQGDTENAKKATQRFLINSTAGFGGTKDVAAEEYGIKSRDEDLGQAVGKHGAEAGAHIELPILGPSNTRDALGTAATAIINPIGAVGSAAKGAVEYSDKRETIKDVTKGALDPYVVQRDAYEQHRDYQIRNAEPPAAGEQDFPGLSPAPEAEPAKP